MIGSVFIGVLVDRQTLPTVATLQCNALQKNTLLVFQSQTAYAYVLSTNQKHITHNSKSTFLDCQLRLLEYFFWIIF